MDEQFTTVNNPMFKVQMKMSSLISNFNSVIIKLKHQFFDRIATNLADGVDPNQYTVVFIWYNILRPH